ncbi:MAG: DUF4880 domain-containing protein [Gammaproteobacteria bacterium]|nr:DUF4880 domain-containing protein [Gammaproteobacteria bacterium]
MKPSNKHDREFNEREAADWFVALDAGAIERATDSAFGDWLRRTPGNEACYERCEAIVALTPKLADDPDLAWAFREAAGLAATGSVVAERPRRQPWYARRELGFGVVALTAVVIVASLTRSGDDGAATIPGISPTPGMSPGQLADTPLVERAVEPESVVLPVAVPEDAAADALDAVIEAIRTGEASVDAGDDGAADHQQRVREFRERTEAGDPELGAALETRLAEARARLDELLLRFTEAHPAVVSARREIEQLEELRDAPERQADPEVIFR